MFCQNTTYSANLLKQATGAEYTNVKQLHFLQIKAEVTPMAKSEKKVN